MKLGLLTDIHESIEHLEAALIRFQDNGVDQIIVIGDLFEMGHRIGQTCKLLADSRSIGVSGNHDYGLCVEPDAATCTKYGEQVIQMMTSLKPRLVIDGCYFSHVEPWLNPEDVADLWYFDGPPDEHDKLARIFGAVPNRLMFAGHYHSWLLVGPNGIQDWNGEEPITLLNGRFFVVIGALCLGRYAIFDTETSELRPFNE